tara:strand:- start:1405 stop:2538 length:1134 start_codon:yes stop_codon:yes gene_type:complete
MAKSLLKIGRKKKASRSRVNPNEPVWAAIDPNFSSYKKEKAYATTWMANSFTTKDLKDATIKYSKIHRKKEMKKFHYSSINQIYFVSVGKYCHIMNKGGSLSQYTLDWLDVKWKELEERGKDLVEETPTETKKPVVSIQERVREKISEYIAEIEEQVDLFSESGYKSEFDMYKWLMNNNVKAQPANAIADYYVPWCDELKETITKKDEQLVEGYSHMKPAQIKRFVEFLDNIIKDATTWGANQKTVRKTRTKKAPSIEKQIARIQYAKENKELKLVSINPALIIGCNQLWVFNTKYRKLMRYDASGPTGLSIKGTTLQGYDVETSMSKTVRKPNDVLPRVLNGGKIVIRKLMDELNSKSSVPNGRINGDTVLLRVVK